MLYIIGYLLILCQDWLTYYMRIILLSIKPLMHPFPFTCQLIFDTIQRSKGRSQKYKTKVKILNFYFSFCLLIFAFYIVSMATPVTFFEETRAELKKVTWPTRNEVVRLTMVVIAVSLVVGLYVGGLDFVFTKLLQMIVK